MYRIRAFEIIVSWLGRQLMRIAFLAIVTVGLSGCLGTRYLQENEKLLYRQKAVIPKRTPSAGLSDIFVQKANRRLLGLPINSLVWMHHEGQKRYQQQKFIDKRDRVEAHFDKRIAEVRNPRKVASLQYKKQRKMDNLTSKIDNGNLFMQWGEAATVFDSAATTLTAQRIHDYYFSKGYFDVTTRTEISERKKRVSVRYHISPGIPYTYDSLAFDVPDSAVLKLVLSQKSFVRRGDRYEEDKLGKERERIETLLRNQGYYDFSRQYIHFDIDSAYRRRNGLAVRISIDNPSGRSRHRVFRVDSLSFTTDAGQRSSRELKRQIEPYRGITYVYYAKEYNRKILSQRVFIRRDSLYSRNDTFESQRQLANLDVFKFVNVNYDSSGGRFIANIFASPLDRYSWSNEAGVTVTQGFPGPYITTNFKKRNLFGGLEIFEITGRFGFEGVASVTNDGNFYRSTEASLNATLTFPQFLFPLSTATDYKLAKYNPRTRLLAGYAFSERPEYTRSVTTFSTTYTWDRKGKLQYSLTPVSLNIIQSRLDTAFNNLLIRLQNEQGNNLRNSFNPSFVSSILFSLTWNPNNYGNVERSSYFVRLQAEAGGTTLNFFTPGFAEARGLELFRYLRFNVDARRNKILGKNTVLAYRINTGVGYSYGDNQVLPYEKYFFVGGSNSVRAWRPRRLGVGTAPPPLSQNPEQNGLFNYQFERPGEILVEGSVELRQKIVGFISTAVFLDAGNVWSFRPTILTASAEQPPWSGTTDFKFRNFISQLGIGTGFGVRFDFSFLVLRLDVGIKAWDPAREEGDRFVLNKMRFWRPYTGGKEPVIYNIGIGYSF